MSPDHCMLIHGKMVRAKYLVNDTIYKEAGECAKHSAIVANGVLSETYVDLDNRHMFEESNRIQPRTYSSMAEPPLKLPASPVIIKYNGVVGACPTLKQMNSS